MFGIFLEITERRNPQLFCNICTIVLVLYSEYVLLQTLITGIKEIDPMIIEAPLATQSIFSGLRLALTSIIGIATIAATINAGGLGTMVLCQTY